MTATLSGDPAALIVVDVQNGFVNDNSQVCLPNIERLILRWKERGWPIYFTQFVNSEGSNWERLIGWNRLRTSPEIDLHPCVLPYIKDETVLKKINLYSSIYGTLEGDVLSKGWQEVVICGIATESCVLATALSVFEVGRATNVRPIVPRDACASHAGEFAHDAGMLVLERFIGRQQVVDSTHLL